MGSNGNGLNNKQRVFVEEYLKCWNATEAARRAGYAERSIRVIASENLAKPNIKSVIEARIAELKMSADEVLLRLANQARGDIGEFTEIGNSSDLGNHSQSAIVKKFKKRTYRPKDCDPYEEIEIELYDTQAALVHLGKAHALFTDNVDHSVKIDGKLVILPTQDG